MAESGVVRTIHGVSVSFPCRPYPSQMSMMEKIIKGIEKKENCLLESPTGSGKSLSLLCAALAWQKAEYEKRDKEIEEGSKKGCICNKNTRTAKVSPTIKAEIEESPSDNGDADDFKPSKPPKIPHSETIPHQGLQRQYQLVPGSLTEYVAVGPGGEGASCSSTGEPCCSDTKPTNVTEPMTKPTKMTEPVTKPTKMTDSVNSEPCYKCFTAPKTNRKVPKIYFGTRTHKQITQIVRELNKTDYKHVRMTILASREHTCIHPAVSKYGSKNEGCKELLDGPGCLYNSNVRKFAYQDNVQSYMDAAWDIEDMVKVCSGRKVKACPYFTTRDLRTQADIVFCPYNYLVSPGIRQSMEIILKDQIVIFDEAHNIENCACEEMCRTVAQDDLHKTVKELHDLINNDVKPQEHTTLKNVCDNISRFITSSDSTLQQRSFNESARIWEGNEIVACLNHFGLGPNDYPNFVKCYNEVTDDGKDDARQKDKKKPEYKPKLSPQATKVLESLVMVLEYMLKDNMRFLSDYKLVMLKSAVYTNAPDTSGNWLNAKKKRRKELRQVISLNFWCFSPAVAFSDFEFTRTVVLTSGTLSPMQSFQSELGVQFSISLEANHVINDSQVWVGALGKGPNHHSIQATYRNTEQLNFQDEVGYVILEVCRKVPRGVLCFLPSYKMLETLTTRWQATGMWENLLAKKQIVCEPRASDRIDFDELINLFYDVVNNEDDTAAPNETGALFMAVCRGKVSEGLDFADNNARAVITVGIPYPSFKDLQVELKRKYNDQNIKKGLLSGGEWYEIQAFRALNQALGRCIRHRHDWGALVMIDDRFVKNPQKNIKGLSKWVRTKACTFQDFTQAINSLSAFTDLHANDTPKLTHGCTSMETSAATPATDTSSLKPSTSSSRVADATQSPVDDQASTASTSTAATNSIARSTNTISISDDTIPLVKAENDDENRISISSVTEDSVIILDNSESKTLSLDNDNNNDNSVQVFDSSVTEVTTAMKKCLNENDKNVIDISDQKVNSSTFPSLESFTAGITNVNSDAKSALPFSTPKCKILVPQSYSTPNNKIVDNAVITNIAQELKHKLYGKCNGLTLSNITVSPIATTAACRKDIRLCDSLNEGCKGNGNGTLVGVNTSLGKNVSHNGGSNTSLYQFVEIDGQNNGQRDGQNDGPKDVQNNGQKDGQDDMDGWNDMDENMDENMETDNRKTDTKIPKKVDRLQDEIDSFHNEQDDWLTTSPTLFDSEEVKDPDYTIPQNKSQNSLSKPKLLFRNAPSKSFTETNVDHKNVEHEKLNKSGSASKSKRKAKNSDISKSHDSDSESDFLNTKRKSSKRKCSTRGKRSKGVEFIDDEEAGVPHVQRMVLLCQKCKSVLLSSTSGLEKKRCVPSFLKSLCPGRQDVYVGNSDVSMNSNLQPISHHINGIELNSHWLADHGICLQYLHCVTCSGQSDGQGVMSVGVRVVYGDSGGKAITGQTTISNPTATSPSPFDPTPSPTHDNSTPSNPASSNPAPSNPTTTNPTPSNHTPSSPTPSNPAPSNPTPTNPTPTNPARFNPARFNPARFNPARFNPAPSNPTPTLSNPTPSNPTHSNPTPTNSNPTPTLSNPTPSNPTLSNTTPTNPTPTNPSPTNPTPTNPTPTNPTPSNPKPTNPTPTNPTPSDPTRSHPNQPHPLQPHLLQPHTFQTHPLRPTPLRPLPHPYQLHPVQHYLLIDYPNPISPPPITTPFNPIPPPLIPPSPTPPQPRPSYHCPAHPTTR